MISETNILDQKINETKKAQQRVDRSILEVENSFDHLFSKLDSSVVASKSSKKGFLHVWIAVCILIIAVIYIAVVQHQKEKNKEEEKKRVEEKRQHLLKLLERIGLSDNPAITQILEEEITEKRLDELLDGIEFITGLLGYLGGLYSKKESLHEVMLNLIRLQVSTKLRLYRVNSIPVCISLRKFLRMFRRTPDSEDTINMIYKFA
ncbi:MAG: hypothetical protein HWE22_15420 [Flavobacteriales bacterium]|nr:hypothetical protein [Flavobacteriales bacterium]